MLLSVKDARRVFQNIQILFGTSPATTNDTNTLQKTDSTSKFVWTDLTLNTDNETSLVIKKLLGNPQVILGVGIGIALSTGMDILKGNAFCAIAKDDIFHCDSLKMGAYAGKWQGSPIDILWALKKY